MSSKFFRFAMTAVMQNTILCSPSQFNLNSLLQQLPMLEDAHTAVLVTIITPRGKIAVCIVNESMTEVNARACRQIWPKPCRKLRDNFLRSHTEAWQFLVPRQHHFD